MANNLYIKIEGGRIVNMGADRSVDVYVIDEDCRARGENANECWSLAAGEDFDSLKREYDKIIESELVEGITCPTANEIIIGL